MDDQDDDSSGITELLEDFYTPTTPLVKHLNVGGANNGHYLPVFQGNTQRFLPTFMMPNDVDPSVETVSLLYFPDNLLDRWVKCTNDYARSQITSTRKQRPVTKAHLSLG